MPEYILADVDNVSELWNYRYAISGDYITGGDVHDRFRLPRAGGDAMEDVRRAAEERASRPKTAAIGASFESERQRTKNALVKQLDSLDGRNIRKIAAAADEPEEEKILRVAAYCRVSTDDIDQAISIHWQIQE